MILPCTDCKYKTERSEGHRSFIGCSDDERRKEGFTYDDYFYHHSCTNYEKSIDPTEFTAK